MFRCPVSWYSQLRVVCRKVVSLAVSADIVRLASNRLRLAECVVESIAFAQTGVSVSRDNSRNIL